MLLRRATISAEQHTNTNDDDNTNTNTNANTTTTTTTTTAAATTTADHGAPRRPDRGGVGRAVPPIPPGALKESNTICRKKGKYYERDKTGKIFITSFQLLKILMDNVGTTSGDHNLITLCVFSCFLFILLANVLY